MSDDVIFNNEFQVYYKSNLFGNKSPKEITNTLSETDFGFILNQEERIENSSCSKAVVLKTCRHSPNIYIGDVVYFNHAEPCFRKDVGKTVFEGSRIIGIPHHFIYRDMESSILNIKFMDSTSELHNEFINPKDHISTLNDIEKLTKILFDLYRINPEWLKVKFKELNVQFKLNDRLKKKYKDKEDRKNVYSAISFFDDLSKKTDFDNAYEIVCKKYNISSRELRSIIGLRNSFKNIKFSK